MKTTLQSRSVLLDEQAAADLGQMMATLSEESGHITRVHSRVASWLISDYATRHFQRDKERIKEALLNRMSFLRSVINEIKDGSEEDIQKVETALRGLRHKRQGKAETKKLQNQMNLEGS